MIQRLQRVFESFRSREVKYLVIGGVASILYGVPRATLDLDILIEATMVNAQGLLAALEEGGFATATMITPEELLSNEVTIFRDRARIDVQTSTPGINFAEAWPRRKEMRLGGMPIFVASKEDLIASKKAAGRPKDLEDVLLLTLPPEDQSSR